MHANMKTVFQWQQRRQNKRFPIIGEWHLPAIQHAIALAYILKTVAMGSHLTVWRLQTNHTVERYVLTCGHSEACS
ncbi:hypothetical protein D3C85_1461710 [compost metagenome]